jgi:hypothetical protein
LIKESKLEEKEWDKKRGSGREEGNGMEGRAYHLCAIGDSRKEKE